MLRVIPGVTRTDNFRQLFVDIFQIMIKNNN